MNVSTLLLFARLDTLLASCQSLAAAAAVGVAKREHFFEAAQGWIDAGHKDLGDVGRRPDPSTHGRWRGETWQGKAGT